MKNFTDKQWDNVLENYRKWWDVKLGRPILPAIFCGGINPGRPEPKNPPPAFSNVHDFSITPEQIVDRIDYDLSGYEYFLDAYPCMHMHAYGPGVVAAFLGAKLENTNDTVWFHPQKQLPPSELEFKYDENNIWLNRIKDIYREGMKKWGGEVVMAMTDLGGMLDILATFCGSENLLLALYDEPAEVKRCVNELQKLWFRFYDEINDILKGSRAYTVWAGILSEKPSYMLQSDFSYMIGTDMFEEFVMPELESSASRLYKSFYHLDGEGELPHLDCLLKSKQIAGIQWVPGDGEPMKKDWSAVYKRISGAEKKIQAVYDMTDPRLKETVAAVNRPDDICAQFGYFPAADKKQAIEKLKALGAV